jgi:hypothetical protein
MAKVAERLSVLKMTTAERNTYFNYLKEAVHSQDVLVAAEEKGAAGEREKGLQKIRQIALTLLKEGAEEGLICTATGFSIDELAQLKQRHKL